MECSDCNITKLSNEFPTGRLSDECDHFPSFCLRCIVNKGITVCPECNVDIDKDVREDIEIKYGIITQAGHLKPPAAKTTTIQTRSHYSTRLISFTVSLMGGDTEECKNINNNITVSRFMLELASKFNIPRNFQRIMFNGQEIKPYIDNHEAVLMDYNIENGSTLQLMKMLLESTVDRPYHTINFTLRWQQRVDFFSRVYLDASCFAYSGNAYSDYTDFKNTHRLTGVTHSGPAQHRNFHTLQVNLDRVHGDITHLFFVMSACRVGSLRDIAAPTIQLCERSRPQEMISDYTINNSSNRQAAIMCCLKRTSIGGWQAFSLGTQCDGNVSNYYSIRGAISGVFDTGVLNG